MSTTHRAIHVVTLAAAFAISSPALWAAELTTTSEQISFPGESVSLSGGIALLGAGYDRIGENMRHGAAYVFRGLETAQGTINENVKLTASDGGAEDRFGASVSLSGSIGLIGASGNWKNPNQNSAYVFRNLDRATGSINESVRLTASDRTSQEDFGSEVSVSGSTGLVGCPSADRYDGAAYVFRRLDTAEGTITQDVKLTASDGEFSDLFGAAVSVSGSIGLVGARNHNQETGAAYVFRNLHTATGTISESVKLTASGVPSAAHFAYSVSLSGHMGLVGTLSDAAYVFRNLDTATGSINENVKLTASDDISPGRSVALSGSIGLVAVPGTSFGRNRGGRVYVFRDLHTVQGTIEQNVKLTPSVGTAKGHFGWSVGLDDDQFVIGDFFNGKSDQDLATGKAYSGSVSSFTALDTGSTTKAISGISFDSQDDWIIGQTTDANQVILGPGDKAKVRAFGRAVYIGKTVTSDSNTLVVQGKLTAKFVNIGSPEGNSGNTVQIHRTGAVKALELRLTPGNSLRVEGRYQGIAAVLKKVGTPRLKVWTGTGWVKITRRNYETYLTATFEDGYTILAAKAAH